MPIVIGLTIIMLISCLYYLILLQDLNNDLEIDRE